MYNIKISHFEMRNGALFSFYVNRPLDDEDIRTGLPV